ncbi:MAG: hypothetical protein HW374_2134, partial [Bacteroidetes bacterium]|nr:hypothetical protein [Bacteroidota bacterium]
MPTLLDRIRKREFEARIFISLGIVLFVCVLSFAVLRQKSSSAAIIGYWLGISERHSNLAAFLIAAALMSLASLLRMWAGSYLNSERIMAFRVQNDILTTQGPYMLVRNPIYLADVLAMYGFALCLPLTGLLLPLLLYLHYRQLMKYEEVSLRARLHQQYKDYARRVPRILPGVQSFFNFSRSSKDFRISWDGFRNNALYLLFAVGFLVSAFTGQFFFAVVIGLPAVLDCAVIHTKKGLAKQRNGEARKSTPQKKARKSVFDDVLYAQCWEDPQLDRAAFGIGKDDVVFSITSGGCNTLTFLLDNPRKVIALDLNPYQNFVLELKIAAFKKLSHDEILEFLGVRDSTKRLDLYRILRNELREESRRYWDGETQKIERGIIHCGRFEAYMRLLRGWVQRLIGASTVKKLFEVVSPAERARFYREQWANGWWWLFTRIL